MSLLLGIDLGSSSVKVALVDLQNGLCRASAQYPATEAPIKSLRHGWAEQNPDDWWLYFKHALAAAMSEARVDVDAVSAIGISYQMHGLVCLDKDMRPLRDAIIWCDSRGVPYGEQAFSTLGRDRCLSHLLNSPGNFTATKLAWVRDNEPRLFDHIAAVMLPGDYLALRLSGHAATTAGGLSEMMLWDYAEQQPAYFLMDYLALPSTIFPPLVPTFGLQGTLSATAAAELGLRAGIPITYRAGDQPNNALSLSVLDPGTVASTAGTSGVVYGVTDSVGYDPLSRINTFLHVNHTPSAPRLGVMHCIGGCGIMNSWLRHNIAPDLSYDQMNQLAATIPCGSEGLSIVPFGNGAERVLQNRTVGGSIHGLDLNRHTRAHLMRAAQEGVAFAFHYGMEIMQSLGSPIEHIHAGDANLFLSPLFAQTLADVSRATISLYNTDGSQGAARGAGIGAGLYASASDAFSQLRRKCQYVPSHNLDEAYQRWISILHNNINLQQTPSI